MRTLHAQHGTTSQRVASASVDHVAQELRERMRDILAGEDPNARVVLLAGFYCAELYQIVTAHGFEVISCDYRWAEHNGMHYMGDIRDILFARHWLAVIAAPPCRDVAWSGSGAFGAKRDTGRQWYGISFAGLMWCASAVHVWMESSGGVLSAFFRPPDLTCHPRDFVGGKG